METTKLKNIEQNISRIGLGTWAIGGWMWGGTDEQQSIKTIRTALDKGVNLIDTAPVYGFGKSEEIVGKALKEYGKREEVVLATKLGLDWKEGEEKPFRNSSRERIVEEIDNSLHRLQTDYIDLIQVHWPDHNTPIEETAEALDKQMKYGRVRAIGVSNYSVEQMEIFSDVTELSSNQPPYNIFERDIEKDILPWCNANNVGILAYSSLCRGMLSGKMNKNREFKGDDLRNYDPKFQGERFEQNLNVVDELTKMASKTYDKEIIQFAVRWVLDKGADIALWGARNPKQLDGIEGVSGWNISEEDMQKIDDILHKHLKDLIGPEFMAPPK